MSWSPRVWDGPLNVRYRVEGSHLVKETAQVGYDEVLEDIARRRIEGQRRRFLGGWQVGSIPENDLPAFRSDYPEFFERGVDDDLKRKALVRFSNDPKWAHCLIKRA